MIYKQKEQRIKRFISGLLTLALVLSSVVSSAHEGMWLPMLNEAYAATDVTVKGGVYLMEAQ